ncbi:MAG: NAD(P)H-binding protein [Gemmatimonadota bacterium]|nr:NAD(P)H-binding protein [Gemmatimonadota bacterium]
MTDRSTDRGINAELHAVTGAFGYSGRYIARRLLDAGHRVVTLTNTTPRDDPFAGRVTAYPLAFADPARLAESLAGVAVLYNTYWVRFNHRRFTHATAVANTRTLFQAAKAAGVRRVVHVSITNPSLHSPLEYFRGKAELEAALHMSGLSNAVLRPTVLFGKEDILINNIAWMLRRVPVFGVFGSGDYRLQPIYVDDLAALAVRHGAGTADVTVDAIGPETFTYRALVEAIGRAIGRPRPILSVPPRVGYWAGRAFGVLVRDVVITREEIEGLMAGLLHVESAPTGTTSLTEWATAHRDTLGRRYASELGRRSRAAAR